MTARHHKKRTIVIILTTTLGLPLLIGAIILVQWANAPVEHVVAADDTVSIATTPSVQSLDTKYFSLRIPGDYRISTATDPASPTLLQARAIQNAENGTQIGIVCNVLPADGLDGVADYHMRKTLTSTYVSYIPDDLPTGGTAFRNPETGELTLFITNGGRYASISVTGIGGKHSLRDLFSQTYTSWQWL